MLWNQSTPIIRSKLEQHTDFPTFDAVKDPIALVHEMRNIIFGHNAHMQDAWSLCKLVKFMLSEWQKEDETNEDWMEDSTGCGRLLTNMEAACGAIQPLIKDKASEIIGEGNVPTPNYKRHTEEAVKVEMKTMFMLAGANKACHKNLCTHVQNSYTVGRNKYPSNTTKLLSMMNT